MTARGRVSLGRLALLFGASVALFGCDAGGLLTAEDKNNEPPPSGKSATDIVNGGTLAKNDKYKMIYTLGQPSPHQGVAKGADQRMNGGLVGATQGK